MFYHPQSNVVHDMGNHDHNTILHMADKFTFGNLVMSISRTVDFGQQRSRVNYTRDLYIALRLQLGVSKGDYCTFHFFPIFAPTTLKFTGQHRINMVPTRWSLVLHCKGFDDSYLTNVSLTWNLTFRRCPLDSPDLSACNFFLCDYLKSKVSNSRRAESCHSQRNCNCQEKCY